MIDRGTAKQLRLQGGRHDHDLRRRAGQAVHDLRRRLARRQRQPGRRALRRVHAPTRRTGWPATTAGTRSRSRPAAATRTTVKAALQRELGRDFEVQTGEEAAEQQAQDLSDALGFIRIALLVFAGVALLVGGFLIFNTFTVTVAQRTKEFALLRVLGASRGQVLRSVLIETFVVGLIASIIGVLAGLLRRAGAGRDPEGGRDRSRHDRDRGHARRR